MNPLPTISVRQWIAVAILILAVLNLADLVSFVHWAAILFVLVAVALLV